MRMQISLVLLVAVFLITPASAELRVLHPDSPDFWLHHGVIMATIEDIKYAQGCTTLNLRISKVYATVTELSVDRDLEVTGPINEPESSMLVKIEKGDVVLCCLNHSKSGWGLESNGLAAMPNGSTIFVVDANTASSVPGIIENFQTAFLASLTTRKSE
jgi:hypothetical protein